jgi:hypothetical protein
MIERNLRPYENQNEEKWYEITQKLITDHPFDIEFITRIVLSSWNEIFTIKDDSENFKIGNTVFPRPQMMGFFLETIITQKIHVLYPNEWIPDRTGYAKDLENILNDFYSIEIKTSSSDKHIYGNRSYGKKGEDSKKSKDGYYLAINFEKFTETNLHPKITMIRFGYLNYSDWKSQKSETGQQASIKPSIEKVKLLPIYLTKNISIPGPPITKDNIKWFENYAYSVKELKEYCKENNLSQKGNKKELRNRVYEYLNKNKEEK